MKKYYRNEEGLVSASITVHRDGTATLSVSGYGWHKKSKHKNERAAYQAWRRYCN